MTEYLITKTDSQAPPEYLDYQIRMMYHIPPSVFHEQRGQYLFDVLTDLRCQQYEGKAAKLRQTLG